MNPAVAFNKTILYFCKVNLQVLLHKMNTTELSTSLRTAVSALHKRLRKQTHSVNSYSMTEIDTIRYLYRQNSLLPSELAVLTKITTQSMSQILHKMERQEIILRTPSDKDKRKVYISLSNKGIDLVKKTRYDKEEWLKAAIEKSLSKEEIVLLEKAIPLFLKLTETN